MQVEHHEQEHGGRFTITQDEQRLGELTYRLRDGVRVIDHTWVDPAARGRGVADRLMGAIVATAREAGWKLSATCSYAVWSFERHPEWEDVRDG